jgi:hypothetical protein
MGGFYENARHSDVLLRPNYGGYKKNNNRRSSGNVESTLTIADFTTDRPALLEINRKIATMDGGAGAIIIVSKNRPLFVRCFRSSEKLGLPPKKTVLAGALELDPLHLDCS